MGGYVDVALAILGITLSHKSSVAKEGGRCRTDVCTLSLNHSLQKQTKLGEKTVIIISEAPL